VEPAEAVALVAAELTLEPGRRVRGLDALELAQPLARPLESLVESRLRLLGQQDVEQPDLRPPEPEVIPLRGSDRRLMSASIQARRRRF